MSVLAQGRARSGSGPGWKWSLRGVAIALLATAMLAAGASTAPAVIVRLANGRTLSYQPLRESSTISPFDAFFHNLDYNGGPVMASNTNYAVYWRPSGAPAYPSDYQPGINQYLTDLAHDSGGHENTDSVSTQYNDAAGDFASYSSRFGGALIDTDPYPANGCKQATICLTDAQLRSELSKYTSANHLPRDLAHEYILLTPPGVEDCFEASGLECSAGSKRPTYCAYHGNVPGAEGQLIYANDPYVSGNFLCEDGNHPNGTTSDGALEGGLSHEHNESITDPEPNNAWTDFGGSGGENGDKCRTGVETSEFGTPLGKAPNGAKYNQLINGRFYWYQQEWSNQSNRCLQRLTFSGAEPTATFTSKPVAGNEVSFDASGSTAPGGVARYNWQFNDGKGNTPTTPVETTTPTVAHTFATTGPYVVALTVFAKDGTSIGTARTIESGIVVSAPTVVTGAASSVTQTAASLNATVNPNGRTVSECKLEYGTTSAYGSSAPCMPAPGSGSSPVAVSASVTGLSNKATYHFRISATNPGGTSNGSDQTFTAATPHVYTNGGKVAEAEKVRTIGWGTLKLTNAIIGEVECREVNAGYLENPTGGGAAIGKIQAFAPYECTSESCKALGGTAIEATAEALSWSTEATEAEAGAFRMRTGNRIKAAGAVFLRVNCVGKINAQLTGEDLPKILNNGSAIGSKPGQVEFDQPGSGELESGAVGPGKISGRFKIEGYEEEELIEVKNP
jgi:PKD domain